MKGGSGGLGASLVAIVDIKGGWARVREALDTVGAIDEINILCL